MPPPQGRQGVKGPAPLSSALDELLAALDLSHVAMQARLAREWESVAGPLLAGRTAPGKLRHRVLTVLAGNHTIAQELQFMKPALLESVRALLGSGAVTDIRIAVGPVPARDNAEMPGVGPAEDRRAGPPLDLDGLDAVPDPEMRAILRSISRKANSRDR